MGQKIKYTPTDYQDLYESYFDPEKDSFVRGLTRRYAGSRACDSDVEDLMHTTFERMLRLKSLEKFNVERGNFGLYLQQIIKSVVYSWHAKNGRTPTVEGLRLEVLPSARGTQQSLPKSSWFSPLHEMEGITAEALDPESAMIAADLEERLFEIAEEERLRGGSGVRSEGLGPMLSILLAGGEAQEVARSMGVTASTVTHWRQYLRAQLNA